MAAPTVPRSMTLFASPRVIFLAAVLGLVACDEKEAPPAPSAAPAPSPSTAPPELETLEVPELSVRPSGTKVRVTWDVPAGTGVNEEAPFKLRWSRSEGLAEVPPDEKVPGAAVKNGFDVEVKPMKGVPHATLDGTITMVVCDVATHAVCVPVKRKLGLGFVVTDDAPASQRLAVKLPEAKPR